MFTREQVLSELRRVAAELGRTPGRKVFQNETGIRESDWSGRYWVRWSDVVADAGLAPNALQGKLGDDALAAALVVEIRRLGRFPTANELKMRARQDADFRGHALARRPGGRAGLVRMALDVCEANPQEYADVLAILEPLAAAPSVNPAPSRPVEPASVVGYVYLVKSGKRYKIGMSTDVQRRLLQLNTGMPQAGELVHVISTDDPAGIEAYWHRRFAAKRVRPDAEWFDLTADDVRAFRRRKFQ